LGIRKVVFHTRCAKGASHGLRDKGYQIALVAVGSEDTRKQESSEFETSRGQAVGAGSTPPRAGLLRP